MQQTVVFDFDGVIHSYTSGWQGAGVISDPPVEGIKEAIDAIRQAGYRVVVVSTRTATEDGMEAVGRFLFNNNIIVDAVQAEKPPAIVYIDDRAIRFDGDTKSLLSRIQSFVPWNKVEGYEEFKNQKDLITIAVELYFKVIDSVVFGGKGSVGYTMVKKSFSTNIIDVQKQYVDSQIGVTAGICYVPIENVTLITKKEYEEETDDEIDD